MKYLTNNYPFPFSLAIRANPFNKAASVVIQKCDESSAKRPRNSGKQGSFRNEIHAFLAKCISHAIRFRKRVYAHGR